MKARWKDISSFAEGEARTPKAWELHLGHLVLRVHRSRYVPDKFSWSAFSRLPEDHELGTLSPELAKDVAISALRLRLEEVLETLNEARHG